MFGMGKDKSGVGGGESMGMEEFEEGLEGVDLATDGFGGVGCGKLGEVVLEVGGLNGGGLSDATLD